MTCSREVAEASSLDGVCDDTNILRQQRGGWPGFRWPSRQSCPRPVSAPPASRGLFCPSTFSQLPCTGLRPPLSVIGPCPLPPGRVEHDRGLYYWIDVYEEGHWQRDLTTAAPRLPTMDGGLGSREPARASWVCLPARPGSRRQPSEASTTKVSLQSIPSPRRTYLQGIYRATTLTPRSERVFPFRSIQAARRARPAQRSSLPPSPPLRDGIRSNPPYTGRTGSCLRAAAVRHPSHAISDAIHRDDVATAAPPLSASKKCHPPLRRP